MFEFITIKVIWTIMALRAKTVASPKTKLRAGSGAKLKVRLRAGSGVGPANVEELLVIPRIIYHNH